MSVAVSSLKRSFDRAVAAAGHEMVVPTIDEEETEVLGGGGGGFSAHHRRAPLPPVVAHNYTTINNTIHMQGGSGLDDNNDDELLPPSSKRRRMLDEHLMNHHAASARVPDLSLTSFDPETYDKQNPWIQGDFDEDDAQFAYQLGELQPMSECYGCIHMSARAVQKHVAVDRTRIDQFINNIGTALAGRNINQAALKLAKEYEENIRRPSNKYLRPGQLPLPRWTAATIKDHVYNHDKNPLFALQRKKEELRKFTETAYRASKEYHPIKKRIDGKMTERVNPEQWKIYREASELELKYASVDVELLMNQQHQLRQQLRMNGGDFMNLNARNTYHHYSQMSAQQQAHADAKRRKRN